MEKRAIVQDEEFLSDLEKNAGLMFSIQEIAVILEVDAAALRDLIRDQSQQAHRAFHRGRLRKDAEIRQAVSELALNGSSPAQTAFLDLIEMAKMNDVL